MPISKSGAALRVDKSACIPFGTPGSIVALTTAYQTLQSITGKGFLDIAILLGDTNANTLRITIDGVVKFEGSSSSATSFSGVKKRDLLIPVATSTTASNLAVINPNAIYTTLNVGGSGNTFGFPYTANAPIGGTLSIVADSIYFNSSLLIEAKSSAAHTGYYYLSGGYQQ